MKEKEKYIVFTGHFGSGKSELAANYAIACAKQGYKTALIDLDIVNPFFRTAEIRGFLESEKITVIAPSYAGKTISLPSLPPEIVSVFQRDDLQKVIFDVGGDETGATALGRYFPHFSNIAYRMLYVINTRRPLSSSRHDIEEMLRLIERSSRLSVTDLINNTNLSYETTPEILMDGYPTVCDVSKNLKLPIRYISGTEDVLAELPDSFAADVERFALVLYQRPIFFG